jgi:glycosidase
MALTLIWDLQCISGMVLPPIIFYRTMPILLSCWATTTWFALGISSNEPLTCATARRTQDYWKRHKLAFSFMGAYTGPIMLYYGEEIGDHVEAYGGGEDYFDKVDHTRETPAAEWGVAEDHVARSSAKIQGISHTLDANQQDLKDYVTAIMQTRQDYPALYRGERVNLEATGSLYADLKVDGDQRVLYITNLGTDAVDFSLPLEGSSATALSPQGLSASLDGINISGTLPPLSAEYFLIQ